MCLPCSAAPAYDATCRTRAPVVSTFASIRRKGTRSSANTAADTNKTAAVHVKSAGICSAVQDPRSADKTCDQVSDRCREEPDAHHLSDEPPGREFCHG